MTDQYCVMKVEECPTCKGEGEVDSGAPRPDGDFYTIPCPDCAWKSILASRSLNSLWKELAVRVGGPLAERILEHITYQRDCDWNDSRRVPSAELLTLIDAFEKVIDDPAPYIQQTW